MKKNWEEKLTEMTNKYREVAKSKITFNELEELAWEYHKKIGNMFLQGIVNDKGDGKNIDLSKSLYSTNGKKPKNKGLKKKT